MAWFESSRADGSSGYRNKLRVEAMERRESPASVSVLAGALTVTGTNAADRLAVTRDAATNVLTVTDAGRIIGQFDSAAITSITMDALAGNDVLAIGSNVFQQAFLNGGTGKNSINAGGGPTDITDNGRTSKIAGSPQATNVNLGVGSDLTKVVVESGPTAVTTTTTTNAVYNAKPGDTVTPGNQVLNEGVAPTKDQLSVGDVETILDRASAVSPSQDAIIAITDRNGRLLGVRVEANVNPDLFADPATAAFAIDGAISLARTGAFFGNDQAPLTSRTVGNLSQSTVTQREVEANPNILDVNSTDRGPGYVAPVRTGAHFPPGIPNTPEVDLFGIEHTNRDSLIQPGADGVKGNGDDLLLPNRFNIENSQFAPGAALFAPESYGFLTGSFPNATSRGVATLPGGIPIFKDGQVVGGIGVFFPGKTGYATESNSALSATYNPLLPDRTLEAEYIAFVAIGGSTTAQISTQGPIDGAPGLPSNPLTGAPRFDLPFGRIDLVGIELDIIGPNGMAGAGELAKYGAALGTGVANGVNVPVDIGGATALPGLAVSTGWIVTPRNGNGITAAEVERIINAGINQANTTRAAIRTPLNQTARMVLAVADRDGAIVGLFRMPDATIFSIDVAVAKARNVNYYADPAKLQPIDQVTNVPTGTAFSNRTVRFLSLPRFPSGAEGSPAGQFSIINDGGSDPQTGLQVGPRLPASAFQSVYGHDSFFPSSNFHDPTNLKNQNGIVFFPGSSPLYRTIGRTTTLIGGFGVSGDGVDQDDVVTVAGQQGFEPKNGVLRADQTYTRGVRLPYQKFNRNPEGGV